MSHWITDEEGDLREMTAKSGRFSGMLLKEEMERELYETLTNTPFLLHC
jgi:hypothetical protein